MALRVVASNSEYYKVSGGIAKPMMVSDMKSIFVSNAFSEPWQA